MEKYTTEILSDDVASGTIFDTVGEEQVFTAFEGSALIEGNESMGGPFRPIANLITGVPFPTSTPWTQIRATGVGRVIMGQLIQDHIISVESGA